MPSANKPLPIIIIKRKRGHERHHGGAWKVAYADFVTAMMALFIVLWLMNSSTKVKEAVAGYFNDPNGSGRLLGTSLPASGETVSVHKKAEMEKLKEKIEQQIGSKQDLKVLTKQIEITVTAEGLRIELLEGKNGTFFESGSAHLSPKGQELLALLASELKSLRNQLLIEGHTDAKQYSQDANYSNWELSADRANAARRLMQSNGVRLDQVTQIRGYADQMLRVRNDPYDPSNRRISILVKNVNGPLPVTKGGVAVCMRAGYTHKDSGNHNRASNGHKAESPHGEGHSEASLSEVSADEPANRGAGHNSESAPTTAALPGSEK